MASALAILSLEAEAQIDWVRQDGGAVDELALNFDDAFKIGPSGWSAEAWRLIEMLDRELESMSGMVNADLWTEAALRDNPQWARVRILAAEALAS